MCNNDYTHEIRVYCVRLLHFNNVRNILVELALSGLDTWLSLEM